MFHEERVVKSRLTRHCVYHRTSACGICVFNMSEYLHIPAAFAIIRISASVLKKY